MATSTFRRCIRTWLYPLASAILTNLLPQINPIYVYPLCGENRFKNSRVIRKFRVTGSMGPFVSGVYSDVNNRDAKIELPGNASSNVEKGKLVTAERFQCLQKLILIFFFNFYVHVRWNCSHWRNFCTFLNNCFLRLFCGQLIEIRSYSKKNIVWMIGHSSSIAQFSLQVWSKPETML